ncbi:MAG: DUF1905 domain-containing protein [Anaerolineales bacterium]|nr:DUF1905 domain-containing protein [Anaerolineales bacterium]
MAALKFVVTLQPGKAGSNHQVLAVLSAEQSARLGSKRTVNVIGTLNGRPFQNSFLPAGGGRHYLVVSQALRQAAQVAAGDRVTLVVEVEASPRPVEAPADLRAALAAAPAAQAAWDRLPPSHRREYLGYLAEARQPETRARRLAQTVARLSTPPKS